VKFEGDRSNPLEVMISQAQEYEKAIRPLFADPGHLYVCTWDLAPSNNCLSISHQLQMLSSEL